MATHCPDKAKIQVYQDLAWADPNKAKIQVYQDLA